MGCWCEMGRLERRTVRKARVKTETDEEVENAIGREIIVVAGIVKP